MSNWSYIVLLGAVVVVASLFLPRKRQQSQESKDTRNMEIALEQFMENTELDHQELVKLVTVLREEGKTQTELSKQRLMELENKCSLLEQQLGFLQQQRQNDLVVAQAYSAPVQAAPPFQAATVESTVEVPEPQQVVSGIQSRYADLFELYNQGKSIEVIAKKLSMNKGEVQLILQLAKQEEKVYV
ncbi:DUF6115 domain-containing protein [Paenibacillus sp. YAF4_2]|uniref:DUF6115 domain-containing protein n=1 Tax=Paenibacillus sp. YAF4_2 TaxID=3233085 RepID=UPI003F9D1511